VIGSTPTSPLKTAAGGGLMAQMFHLYNLNRDEYLSHDHKRTNVESTDAMLKAKFGDSVRAKTDVAMANEALCKVLCHNLCCLIPSTDELGVEATSWGKEPTAPPPTDGSVEVDPIEARAWVWTT
jgi:hypothetical protein